MRASNTMAVEIHIRIKKRREVEVSQKFMKEAVERWVLGSPVEGVEITAISWSRDDREKRWAHEEDKIEEVRANMLRRLLWRCKLTITKVS
jgi:hypothetical protein